MEIRTHRNFDYQNQSLKQRVTFCGYKQNLVTISKQGISDYFKSSQSSGSGSSGKN